MAPPTLNLNQKVCPPLPLLPPTELDKFGPPFLVVPPIDL